MKVTRQIHNMWKEMQEAIKVAQYFEQKELLTKMLNNIGKYQYIYETEKGQISLITLPNYFYDDRRIFEIYCLKGDLFEDVERFYSKKKAVERIKELLE